MMKTVCVTGGGGYVASWLVKLLLHRGYTVRATVRDPSNAKKTAHLVALEGAKERLELFKADLLEQGSFDDAVDGCDGVFHTASPFHDNVMTDPQAEMIDPAVKGTLNVLTSCAKSKTVKRVVLTSSIAANALTQKPLTPDVVVDESWWSDVDFCRQIQQWYCLSKTLAESAAWEYAKEKGIDMVTLNPGMIIGPLLQPTLNTSASWILKLITGAETFVNATFGWVDVRDVANAHVLAYENPAASGRCLLIKVIIHQSEMVDIIRHLYPALKLPQKCVDEKPFPPKYCVSQAKAKALGLEFLPFELSIKDTIESLREKNFVDSDTVFLDA